MTNPGFHGCGLSVREVVASARATAGAPDRRPGSRAACGGAVARLCLMTGAQQDLPSGRNVQDSVAKPWRPSAIEPAGAPRLTSQIEKPSAERNVGGPFLGGDERAVRREGRSCRSARRLSCMSRIQSPEAASQS